MMAELQILLSTETDEQKTEQFHANNRENCQREKQFVQQTSPPHSVDISRLKCLLFIL